MSDKEKMIYRTFRTEVKAVDKEEGTIDMLIPMSTGSTDRSGEAIDPMGWKNSLPAFQKRAILVSSHTYGDLRKQIGELTNMKAVKRGLLAKPKYYINQGNAEADWGFKLASMGMAAYSVGFIPIKWVDDDKADGKKKPKRTYTEQELLEISHVILPSNRDTTQQMRGKSDDPIINKVIDDVLEKDDLFEIEDKEKVDAEETNIGKGEEINLIGIESEVVTKPEETDDYIRIPVRDCKVTATITISADQGIKALYCGKIKKIRTYLFAKAKGWTMTKAKKWVADHGKAIDKLVYEWVRIECSPESDELKGLEEQVGFILKDEKEEADDKEDDLTIKQIKEIFPELSLIGTDFIFDLIKERKEFLDKMKELEEKLKDIELKSGAVLNIKNKKDLKTAQILIQSVLDSATTGEEEDSLEITDEKGEDDKGDNTGADLGTDTVDNPPIDEKEDEDKMEVDEKVIAEIIEKRMNYLVGKVYKSNT